VLHGPLMTDFVKYYQFLILYQTSKFGTQVML